MHRVPLPGVLEGSVIGPRDELRWAVLPQGLPDGMEDVEDLEELDDLWAGTAVTVDLLTDSGCLDDHEVRDQYGVASTPDAQAAAKHLWVDQWNLRRVPLGALAGQTVQEASVVVRASPRRPVTVFVDAVQLAPAPELGAEPVDQVRTTRGSHSSPQFSRGNTAPLVGVPHGRLYGVPVTDADDPCWVYRWHGRGALGDPRPRLQALATSHLPSPWIGDRGAFQLMPALGNQPSTGRAARGLAFDHDEESDRPHLWRARLEGGIEAELTAGDCVMGVRCTFPDPSASIVLDHRGTVRDVVLDCVAGRGLTLSCLLDDAPGAPPHHVHLRIPAAVGHSVTLTDGRLRGHVRVDARGPVEAFVGLSTVDSATAAAHVRRCAGFDMLVQEARLRWNRVLSTIEVDGATVEQTVALRSSLYRQFLYPMRYDEPAQHGTVWRSPYGTATGGTLRAAELGPKPEIGGGACSATNGFWDTYRTAWPLLGLLDPASAGLLADGFLAHFRDSGWMPRWSAPGAVDSMTGTTSDTVLADLLVKGTPGIDLRDAWSSALTHASVPPSDPRVGRKGLHPALFRGYVSTAVPEGVAWTLDGAMNDWAGAQIGRLVAAGLPPGPERDRVEAEVEWLARRSLLYGSVFDRERGFFVGRTDDGDWRVDASSFDPDEWGTDYTETNAWGTVLSVPHDGRGLADLHGGEAGLSDLLDRILARPETGSATQAGSYGGVIHEMTEARDCRMGMLALSNQPAHHMPFMLMHVGRHDDAHALVAEALDRLFVGSDLGQGYPGDEDNGEMSAWWVLATIGLYPLVPASGTWVLTPPRVPAARIRPVGGAPVDIEVVNFSPERRFIRSVRIDGAPWQDVSVPHGVLARGARIQVELSRTPCGWARDSRPVSARDVHGYDRPLVDITRPGRCTHPPLVDDVGATAVRLAAGEVVEATMLEPTPSGTLVTVTADRAECLGWELRALVDGAWVTLDVRRDEGFDRACQTRVFRVAPAPGPVTAVRIIPDRPCVLRQVEVFGP